MASKQSDSWPHKTAWPSLLPTVAPRKPQEEWMDHASMPPPSLLADPMDMDPPSPQDMPSGLNVCPGSSFQEDVPIALQAKWLQLGVRRSPQSWIISTPSILRCYTVVCILPTRQWCDISRGRNMLE
ncbi:uncharacterized protein LOC126354178 isoform X1 [Schistocerca gregaria]|uniref:uncharacterized protein LOC126354178 isoform X1 n=1 Tax=Schistocerca gregaria TaxID=7010 RepID=UPI00211E9FBA|nr:uncharacterized protein LOC126354178 isoform X1 [Schistocerca gregaria]